MSATNDTAKAAAGQPLWKDAPGSARIERQVRKLKAKGAIEKTLKEVEAETSRADREIRFHCFLRDHRRCRIFGVLLKFDADESSPKSAWNHHIIFKSAGGSDDPSNRLTICWKAHKMIHDGLLEIIEPADANTTVRVREYEMLGGTRHLLREFSSPNPSELAA